jgi:hypothetical protein
MSFSITREPFLGDGNSKNAWLPSLTEVEHVAAFEAYKENIWLS